MLQLSIGVPLWLWMPSEPPAVHAMDLRNQWPSQHQLGMLDIQLISGLIPDRSGITASLYLKDLKAMQTDPTHRLKCTQKSDLRTSW